MAPQLFSGKYVIQEEIARGGMGVILKALDRALNRVVAIKLVHAHLSGDASFVERFLREARAMARLQHDNIVTIYEWGDEDGQQFLVMEFFGPSNLRTLIRQPHRLPLRDVVRIGHQLSSALAYAHSQSIIHRDIKPANVLIDKKGKAKLTDFGIAAALDEASITSTGQVIGTPEYMSPEQARGVKLDGRSDLYSLGILLYEMLAGKPPYADTSKTAILGKLVFEQQELSLQFPSDVPTLLQGVVRDLLRRNPDDRIPDADTLANQLHEIMYTLPQRPSSTTSIESEPTIVSVPIKPSVEAPTRIAAPPLENPVEPLTKTILQPRTDILPMPPSPAARPTAPPLAQNLDETTLLPAQTPAPSKYVPPESSSTPPPPPPATPPSIRLLPLIGGSVVVVVLLVGLISYLASRPIAPSEAPAPSHPSPTSPLPSQPAISEGPAPSPTRTAQAEELEKQRKQLEEEANRLEEKKRLAAVQQAKEEAERRELERQRDRTIQRAKEEELQRKAAEAARDEERQRSRLEQQRKAEELAKLDRERQQAEARRLQEEAELKRLQVEREKAARTAREEEQLRQARLQKQREEAEARRKQETQVASLPPPAVVPSPKLQTGPDQRLRTLVDRFKTAYEGHDLPSLQAISQMSESRAHNVAFMFSNYSTLRTSIQDLTVSDDRATAIIVIDQAIKLDGEVVSLSPIAKTIKIHISKQGEEWGKISW